MDRNPYTYAEKPICHGVGLGFSGSNIELPEHNSDWLTIWNQP
jgi:hypothetical protein